MPYFLTKYRKALGVILPAAFFLLPYFELRVAIFLIGIILLKSEPFTLSRPWVFLGLFFLFSLAFLFAPYYHVPADPFLKIFFMIFLTLAGLIWAKAACGELEISAHNIGLAWPALLAALLYLASFWLLRADIPWRGDEDYFIITTMRMAGYLESLAKQAGLIFAGRPLVLAGLVILALLAGFAISRGKLKTSSLLFKTLLLGLFLLILASFFLVFFYAPLLKPPFLSLTRYPYITIWLGLLATYPETVGDVALYRMFPFLSAILTAWVFFGRLNQSLPDKKTAGLLSLGLVTVPLIYFYSSLLYIEMPAMFLMTVCLFDSEALLNLPVLELKRRFSWYSLLALAFFKETVVVFLAVMLLARLICRLKALSSNGLPLKKLLLGEAQIILLVFLPLLLYLIFRLGLSQQRRHSLALANLLSPANYLYFAQALLRQTGILAAIALAGLALLFKNKRSQALLLIAITLLTTFFFISDDQQYIGFGRWNLFLLPATFVAAFAIFKAAGQRLLPLFLIGLLVSNIILAPTDYCGIRRPDWAAQRAQDGERAYPYAAAIKWLSQRQDIATLLMLGRDYGYYGDFFYSQKYRFYPRVMEIQRPSRDAWEEKQNLMAFFREYSQLKEASLSEPLKAKAAHLLLTDAILYHSLNKIELNPNLVYGKVFRPAKRFCNNQHCLYIFMKEKNLN